MYTKHTALGALPSSVEHIDRLSTIKINYDTHDPNASAATRTRAHNNNICLPRRGHDTTRVCV